MTRFDYPFAPDAPPDTLDGVLVAEGIIDAAVPDPAHLRMLRSAILPQLRRRCPTAVGRPAGTSIRQACLRALLARDGTEPRCHICGLICPRATTSTTIVEVDHVVPLSRGGRHHLANLALTHRTCNQLKNSSEAIAPEAARAALFAWIERKGYTTGWIGTRLRADLEALEQEDPR